jgi:hypothetical protein
MLTLSVLPEPLAVCRLPPDAPAPAWAQGPGPLVSVTRTPRELSVVCAWAAAPADVQREGPWRGLEVAGPLDFSLTGILAALVAPLARDGLSVFAFSTYDTDYLLVRAERLAAAVASLRAAGHAVHGAED